MEITLALGGGGTRGIAHLGVIEQLEKSGVQIRAVAGTSIGALVGAIYSAGVSPGQMKAILSEFHINHLYRRLPDDGPALLGHAGLVDALSGILNNCTFADLKIPFACTAVDLNSRKEVYLKSGDVLDAVLASSAFPGVLPPKQIGDAYLVDGGILDPVPVCLARQLAPNLPVVAVVLQPAAEDWGKLPEANILDTAPLPIPHQIIQGFARLRIGQAMRIFSQSMDINSRMVAELRLKIDQPDIIIRPDVIRFGMFEMADIDVLVEAGDQATRKKLPEIRKAASLTGKINRLLRQITPVDEPTILKKEAAAQERK